MSEEFEDCSRISFDKTISLRINKDDHQWAKKKNLNVSKLLRNLLKEFRKKHDLGN